MSSHEKAGGKRTIYLRKVECTATGEPGKGGDDIFIKYTVDSSNISQRHPEGTAPGFPDMKAGDVWVCNLPIEFVDHVQIHLHEIDNALSGAGEYLGSVLYKAGDELEEDRREDTNSEHDGHYFFVTGPTPAN